MFNLFKKSQHVVDTPKPVTAPVQHDRDAYAVGKTELGETTLRVGYTTLTMTDKGVQQMIKLLEAAIDDSDDSEEAERDYIWRQLQKRN